MNIESYGVSDIGLVRQNNEDVWAFLPESHFYALADGMGGHKAGEVAAKEAIAKLCASIQEKLPFAKETEEAFSCLKEAIDEANAWVYHLSEQNENYRGMGTTICCFLLRNKKLIYAHVGDSRIYRFKEELEQLTTDHSLRPYKNIITRAIGTISYVEPEIAMRDVEAGDIYFLCSDGLTDYVSSQEIQSVLQHASSIKEAADHLVHLAKGKGGSDNITIVMIKIS